MSNRNLIFAKDDKYEIYKFNKTNLVKALYNNIYPKEKIESSKLFRYLVEYFTYHSAEKSQARTIIVEKEYISESYLNDIRLFYWSNFKSYPKFCRRLHFFGEEFSKKELQDYILQNDKKFFEDNYLGYLVVKPTGNSLLGPTFLKTYGDSINNERHYNSVVDMKINLFGIEIPIRGLVFQEQDGAVGVCATQAIWSAMNKLSSLFRIDMLSPSEISSYGGLGSKGRVFPNSGLSNDQIFKIFRKAKLTVELMALSENGRKKIDKKLFKRIVYAYNRIGIPILLGYFGINGKGSSLSREGQRHLVTIIGYRIDKTNRTTSVGINTLADNLFRLYVHNDQIGPYTKIGFDEKPTRGEYEIQSNWIGSNNENVVYDSLLVPLKNSIRIRYQNILQSTTKIDRIVKQILKAPVVIEWDIYLDKSTNYKRDILLQDIDDRHKMRISVESFPKYIWVARLNTIPSDTSKELKFDILFDSSESPTSFCIHRVFYYDLKLGIRIVDALDKDGLKPLSNLLPSGNLSETHIIKYKEEFDKSFNYI
ncbi:hypothetical protein [uncultured Dokdonia sp.]|uniref:hypothetical protein n=1 Tax=uncultured Dokdonia sp. TaxID=575653 RepID=UPI002603BDA1|nr:hypothetical protein [uncultured Dokdonia sp.]